MDSPEKPTLGKILSIGGVQYKVIEELKEHLLIVPNTGIWPNSVLTIPREPGW